MSYFSGLNTYIHWLTEVYVACSQVSKNQRYRFSLIINELRHAEIIPYKICLLSFINCILMSTEDFEARVRLRNEFIGLQLLDILTEFRFVNLYCRSVLKKTKFSFHFVLFHMLIYFFGYDELW